ncbi:signal peptidase II [Desulfurivibrio sp. D14AmB]|uniref:signal peptidase II n=1 Tax=Desulfurivibrio sp. D14AmB TaxID=3374370 RepID=UPI00376F2137
MHRGPLSCLLLLVVLDQASKWWIKASFVLYESREVIPGLFSLVYYTNTGAAFGLLAGESTMVRRLFFVGVALAALVLLGLLYRQVRQSAPLYLYSLALIASGAIGNLIDRVRFGQVTDFLDFYWRGYHWPAFNIADSAITMGVALFLLASWRQPPAGKIDLKS